MKRIRAASSLLFALCLSVNSFATEREVLTCKNPSKAAAPANQKPAVCAQKAESDAAELKKLADACKKTGVTGLTDDFVREFAKIETDGSESSHETPEGIKHDIESYQELIKSLKVEILGLEKEIAHFNQKEYEQKKAVLDAQKMAFQEKQHEFQKKYDSLPAGEDKQTLLKEYYKMTGEYFKVSHTVQSKESLLEDVTSHKSDIGDYEKEIKKLKVHLKKLANEKPPAPKDTLSKDRIRIADSIKTALEQIRSNPDFVDCGMTDVELFMIWQYTGSLYHRLNGVLRGNDEKEKEKYQYMVQALNSGLSKIAGYNGLVKRGASLDAASVKELCEGCTVTMKAFTSASTNQGFGGEHHFVINSVTGAYVDPISSSQGEKEVLFRSGTKFKVLKVEGNNFTLAEVEATPNKN